MLLLYLRRCIFFLQMVSTLQAGEVLQRLYPGLAKPGAQASEYFKVSRMRGSGQFSGYEACSGLAKPGAQASVGDATRWRASLVPPPAKFFQLALRTGFAEKDLI